MFVFGIIAIEAWDTHFPIWAFMLALIICTICLIFILRFLPELIFVLCFSVRVYRPYWRDPGHYEPAGWAQRHHGAHHRIRTSWSSDCDDVVQDMGLYYHDAGAAIHE
jgi:hypothetical protein